MEVVRPCGLPAGSDSEPLWKQQPRPELGKKATTQRTPLIPKSKHLRSCKNTNLHRHRLMRKENVIRQQPNKLAFPLGAISTICSLPTAASKLGPSNIRQSNASTSSPETPDGRIWPWVAAPGVQHRASESCWHLFHGFRMTTARQTLRWGCRSIHGFSLLQVDLVLAMQNALRSLSQQESILNLNDIGAPRFR